MKKYLMMLLTVSCLVASSVSEERNIIDPVATVNGVSITAKHLDGEVAILLPRTYYHGTVSGEKLRKVQLEALDNLIENELLFQEGKLKGLTPTDDELKENTKRIIADFGGQKKFDEALKKVKISQADFNKVLTRELTVKKVIDKEVTVEFSDEDLKRYYEENREKFKEPERLKARLIVVNVDPTDVNGTKKAREKINEAYEKVADGEDFADVAAKYSHDMTRIMGGDLGYLHAGMLDSRLEEKLHQLKPNEVSEIVDTEIGFSFIKLEEKKPARQLSYDMVKVKLKQERTENVQKKRREALLERLKSGAKIEILIK